MSERPFSQAAENNKGPILAVLRSHCDKPGLLLEIGAGTGQHAAWLSSQLPHLRWQASDVAANLPMIRSWLSDIPGQPLPPIELDVAGPWPALRPDYLFSANTFHIMAQHLVSRCIREGCQRLQPNGLFMVYGPFNYAGQFTSASNAAFDQQLRAADPQRGIRDQEWVVEQFALAGLQLRQDHAMPANNRLLVFARDEASTAQTK